MIRYCSHDARWLRLTCGVGLLLMCAIGSLPGTAAGEPWGSSERVSVDGSIELVPIFKSETPPGMLVPDGPELPTAEQLAAAPDANLPAVAAEARRVSVLVYMDPVAKRGTAARAAIKTFATTSGGRVQYEYKVAMPNVLNLRDMPVSELEALKQLPGVVRIEEDEYHPNVVRLHDSIPLIRGLQTQISAAGLSADGNGVRICIVDTGIDTDHIMYSSRIDLAASYDFHNNDSNPEDDHGHGSHCAGIAAGGLGISWEPCGAGTGSEVFQGVAPQATLISAKVLNASGGGLDSNIIAGIDHCADQSPSGGRADVISMSIGTGNYSGPCTHSWAVAANNAVANGVVAIAASGNENNSNSMGSPACGANVIAVGMTWKADYPTCEDPTTNWNWGICTDVAPQTDDVGCFSNESDDLDVTAPGANIWSASITAGGSSITGSSGTSMSCPTVAGLAALLLDVDPTLTPAEVRTLIRQGAIDMGPAGFDRAYGYGRIDVINTLNLLAPCTGDPDCDDGQWCNGAETCVAQSCQAGVPPCGGDPCDEATDSCLSVAYEWNLNTNPGWTMQGQWAYGKPTGGGGEHGGPDPTSGATGTNVLGYNLSGDYGAYLPETHLTSTAVSCSGLTNVSLRFKRWLGVEQPLYDHAYVRVSNNGSTWTTVWQNSSEIADSSWVTQEFDISAIADNQPTVYLRWTMGTTDGSWFYCGWNIDDIQIWGVGGGPECTVPADCDDGVWCNGAEDCVGGSCVAGTAPNCNDGVGCTDDSCNEGTDSCDNIANDSNCDNGQWCDGVETCHPTLHCQSGAAPDCDDGVDCTNDSCNEGTDSCDNVPSDGLCDDGLYCNGTETCDPVFDCQAGTAIDCDDGVGCTDDACNEGTDSCDNVANQANCDNGFFCDGAETCHTSLDCQAGSDPCPGRLCDEGSDSCFDCTGDPDCDDGVFCNGAESCVGGACQPGTAVNCNDGVACTVDSCNKDTDSCDHVPDDGACDNGLYCDGAETCHPTLDCQSGMAVNCNDGVGCTEDSCNESTDSCDHVANNANCPDDGLFCTGTESCDPVADCVSSGDPCQGGTFCNETSDACESAGCQVPADCDDGSACTVDTCTDGVCSNDCAGAVTTFPYSENFDAGMGTWTNVSGDDFNWTRDANGTPSSSTGPSGDHTTGSGYYVYIETSSPRVQGDYAILAGPCLDLSGTSTVDLTFWYHMYGATTGTLDVEVSDDWTNWTNVWSLSGNRGNSWFQASVNLDAYAGSVVKLRFIGTRGSSYTGDIAIDDIGVDAFGTPCSSDPQCNDGDACTMDACIGNVCQNTLISCDDGNECTVDTCAGGVCTNLCPAEISSFPYAEGFESGWGDWSNIDGDGMDWTRRSGSTPSSGTGPSGAHGGTYYVYTESSSPNYPNVTGIIEGACFDFTGASDAELTFWYHMYGSAMGTLYVEVTDDCNSWTTVWSLSGNRGNTWYQATVDLSAYDGTIITIRFRGVTGTSYTSDICVDDIMVTASAGPECSTPAECDDGLYCNGAEDCVGGSCVAGTAVVCGDGVACTDDSCNEGTDSCDNVTNDANCDNGLWCDGAETCHATLGCQAGTAPNCSDGVGCTDDSCNEGTDSCNNFANHANCDNGVFCDGAETCHVTLDCLAGSSVDCDDGVGCTDDACNESTDSCDNIANDTNCPDDGLFCNGAEYCDAGSDCNSTGDPCTGGDVCNETTDTCDPGTGARLESGSVVVGGSPVTVPLVNSYVSPVVVCSLQYAASSRPTVVRVSNVTSTSFDIYLQVAAAGSPVTERVHYLVVEEGTWIIDGVKIEAQTYLSTVTDENNSWVGQAQSYGQAYTNPVVVGQVMSDNDAAWSVFWDQGNARTNPPSATSLRTGKTVCEDTVTTRANETIGFIVIEAGHGSIGGVEFEAALGAPTIQGVGNGPPFSYTFNFAFASVPEIAVVTMAAMDGGNGGWAYTFGGSPLSATSMNLAIDEDQIGDSERNHVSEQVGYIVFAQPALYP